MASLWQKEKTGLWCVTYRENGKRRTRSLRTRNKREALRLKRAIETTLEERGHVILSVSDRPKPETKDPTLDGFWKALSKWATENRTPRTVEEYENWFTQFREFTKAERLGDIGAREVEDFKAALKKQGKRKRKGIGLEETSINNGLKTLNAIFNQ